MTEFTPQSAHQRARAVNVTNRVLGQLASTPEFKIHESELSNWMRGGATLRKEKREAVRTCLEQIEDLVASTVARIDLTDANNVRIALNKLAEIRASTDPGASARNIFSGSTEPQQ
jgi:hypothetical protein